MAYIISSGDSISGIILEKDTMTVLDGGVATDTTVNSTGYLKVSSGGTATGITTVNSGGTMLISNGGTASAIVENGGFVSFGGGAAVSFASHAFSDLVLSKGSATVHSGTTAISATVTSGIMWIYSGGSADNTQVRSGGSMRVISGGIANLTTLVFGGKLYLSGGTANSTTISNGILTFEGRDAKANGVAIYPGGTLQVFSGTADNVSIISGGSLNVSRGGIVNGFTVDGWNTTSVLANVRGGTVNDTVMSGGTVCIGSGGTANSTTLDCVRLWTGPLFFNAKLIISSGGVANHTIINGEAYDPNNSYDSRWSGGIVDVLGGTANHTTVRSGGTLNISQGCASDTMVGGYPVLFHNDRIDSGTVNVFSEGMADGITVNPYGTLNISGGTVTAIRENGGYVNVADGSASFLSNTFSGVVVIAPYYDYAYFGAESSAIATVHSGTTALNPFILRNGLLEVFSGGKVTGRLFCSSGSVMASDGAIVDFDLSQIDPGAFTRINDLTCILGTPTYTITVRPDQTEGVYTLAEGASEFDGTITMVNTSGTELGTLTVGNTTAISGIDYTLSLSGRTLSLTVGSAITPLPYTSDGVVVTDGRSIQSGAVFHETVVMGHLKVESGGVADTTTVLGSLTISSGGTAYGIIENGGYVEVQDGAEVTFAPHTFSSAYIGMATLHSGTTAYDIKISEMRGQLYIYGGAVVSGVEAMNPGRKPRYSITVFSGGTANDVQLVNQDCVMYVSSGGVANHVFLNRESYMASGAGRLVVSGGGTANYITVDSEGKLEVKSGGTASDIVVNSGGSLVISEGAAADTIKIYENIRFTVSSGATATNITENGGYVEITDGATVSFAPNTFTGVVIPSDKSASLHSGTIANSTTISNRARLYVSSGGMANDTIVNTDGHLFVSSGGTANRTTLNSRSMMSVFAGGTANSTIISSGGNMRIMGGGILNSTIVYANGNLTLNNGGKVTGKLLLESEARVSMSEGTILDFDLTQTEACAEALVNNLSIIQGTPVYTLTVDDSLKPGSYVYALADGAESFASSITVVNKAGDELGTLTVGGESVFFGGTSYTLNLTDSTLSVTVEVPVPPAPENLVGTKDRVSWDPSGTGGYVLEYSTDDFAHAVQVETTGTAADTLALPAGTYQWRVRAEDGEDWAVGDEIVSDNESVAPKVLQSNADGSDDVFFATPVGTWGEDGCYIIALHAGSVNDWRGTRETVYADGKGRIQNLFFGSSDPNVLCLSDGDNGDAIFVDDIYTDSPDDMAKETSRLYKIQEIRAGAGDDIVDMTSCRFEYTGDGLTIRGGDGDDVIWANKGDNWLFGDAGNDRIVGASGNDVIAGGIGNDRMHGGGGNDVFTFCDNWGVDTVEQLSDGEVMLWFAEGSKDNWDEATLIYTDGDNSVKVSGITADKVTLKFGDDGSTHFTSLASAGAFLDATSARIFEESGKGVLASL